MLDKAILHGKEHRKPYINEQAIDRTCRNHGSCPWCKENRLWKFRDKHGYDNKHCRNRYEEDEDEDNRW